jgi:hypothetical protein
VLTQEPAGHRGWLINLTQYLAIRNDRESIPRPCQSLTHS